MEGSNAAPIFGNAVPGVGVGFAAAVIAKVLDADPSLDSIVHALAADPTR